MIEVWIERGDVRESVRPGKGMRIFNVLEMLGISPEAIVPVKNGEVVPEDEPIKKGDRLELRAVKVPG